MKTLGLLAVLSLAAFAGEWTGHISETKCGAKHTAGSAADVTCVTACIKDGAKPVLVVDGKVVSIANADKVPASLYGLKVKVTGELENNSLTIATIAAAE